ncbi:MAG: hypothetical protein ACI9NC_001664, partial [Verrucomicrobiales bacterium]
LLSLDQSALTNVSNKSKMIAGSSHMVLKSDV